LIRRRGQIAAQAGFGRALMLPARLAV
jgi:hypothetical protein